MCTTKATTKKKAPPKRRAWTAGEVRHLKQNAKKHSVPRLARELRRSPGAVRQMAHAKGISCVTRKKISAPKKKAA